MKPTIGLRALCLGCLFTAVHAAEIQPTWESMAANCRVPDWFRDGKIGVWMHWGNGTSGTEFHAEVSEAPEGLKLNFRLDESGLAALPEEGVALDGSIISIRTYTPGWVVAPATLSTGAPVVSSTRSH